MSRRTAPWTTCAVLALLTSACGVPTGGAPERVAPADIPYGLNSAAPSDAPATSSSPRSEEGLVYLVSTDDVLVPAARAVEGDTLEQRVTQLLSDLAAGPSSDDLDGELTTALPPESELRLTAVTEGTATIDLSIEGDTPSGPDSRLAVGQIVLTATSLPGVQEVALTLDGEPLEAPLPSGELTAEPLGAEDYAALRTSPPP